MFRDAPRLSDSQFRTRPYRTEVIPKCGLVPWALRPSQVALFLNCLPLPFAFAHQSAGDFCRLGGLPTSEPTLGKWPVREAANPAGVKCPREAEIDAFTVRGYRPHSTVQLPFKK